ncbi:MAG: hypothetical protein N3D84_02360 [Candidatus Woesearchaeota archaeon]|nr:hypothetical protein [Candidatus Woesearchaeota archaeon]
MGKVYILSFAVCGVHSLNRLMDTHHLLSYKGVRSAEKIPAKAVLYIGLGLFFIFAGVFNQTIKEDNLKRKNNAIICVGELRCTKNGTLQTSNDVWENFNEDSRQCRSCENYEICNTIVAAMDGDMAKSHMIHCKIKKRQVELASASQKYEPKTCAECSFLMGCFILNSKRNEANEEEGIIKGDGQKTINL